MSRLSGSEVLFWGGLAIMAVSVVLAGICVIVFRHTSRRLKEQLNREYGKPLNRHL